MSLEEQIYGFLNEKNITPYQHIYNADGNAGWDIEVLIEEFAERYAQQKVNEVLEDNSDTDFFYAKGALRWRIKELERYQLTANSRESKDLQEEIDEINNAILKLNSNQ